jgi:cyclophilin family peptidyl-prolyl cis-trans isomerase
VLISLRKQLGDGFEAVRTPIARADVANIDCRLAAAVDRLTGELVNSLTCGFGLVAPARRVSVGLQELAHGAPPRDVEKRVADMQPFVTDPSNQVRMAALDVLGATKSTLAFESVRSQLTNEDPVVAATAASAAAALQDKEAIGGIRQLAARAKPDIAPTLAAALAELDAKDAMGELQTWLGSPYSNVRLAAAEALTALSGHPVVAPPSEGGSPRRAKSQFENETKLFVKTIKGDFVITLDVERAPVTVANIVTLAKRGFYKNVTFHRIVPDFVAQGGDPRGDGEGGPGYAIRCEINQHPYTRMAVGMALSGKDTGGSQFFVTTSAQPHLDGRYTAFGDVTSGQEVVDSLLEGDALFDITPRETKE